MASSNGRSGRQAGATPRTAVRPVRSRFDRTDFFVDSPSMVSSVTLPMFLRFPVAAVVTGNGVVSRAI